MHIVLRLRANTVSVSLCLNTKYELRLVVNHPSSHLNQILSATRDDSAASRCFCSGITEYNYDFMTNDKAVCALMATAKACSRMRAINIRRFVFTAPFAHFSRLIAANEIVAAVSRESSCGLCGNVTQ